MCCLILSRVSQFASWKGPETKPSRGITPSCGDLVNSKKVRAETLSTPMLRASRRACVPSMSSSLGDSLGFVRYLSNIWSRALRVEFEPALEGLLKKLVGEKC